MKAFNTAFKAWFGQSRKTSLSKENKPWKVSWFEPCNHLISDTSVTSDMAPTDLENLLDMGFEEDKAKLALKKSGNRRSPWSLTPNSQLLTSTDRQCSGTGGRMA